MPSDRAAKLARINSASLCDAVAKRFNHRAHVTGLVSPTPGRAVFGPAATMLFAPLRDDHKGHHTYARHLAAALGDEWDGKIVIMACGAHPEAAVVGGVRVADFDVRGVAGLVTDGRVRDFWQLSAMNFGTFCAGRTPRAGSREAMPVAANIPVPLGGATIMPGDYVFADDDGVVVLPAADVDALLDEAVAIEAKDDERMAQARTGGAV